MTPRLLLIGIDDTDDAEGPGTGRRARDLGRSLAEQGLGLPLGVTRHQLLVDDRIPYTSHNSALCLALETSDALDKVAAASRHFLLPRCAPGSDPGLCLAWAANTGSILIEFGRAAQQTVLSKTDAVRLASENGLWLEELGGTGDGIIGALAAVGLRASGQDGRFVDLPGIRDLHEDTLPAKDILARTVIDSIIVEEKGEAVPPDDLVHFGGWLRPNLRQGRPVLVVRSWADDCPLNTCGRLTQKGWVTLEHKHKHATDAPAASSYLLPGGSLPSDTLGRPHRGK